MAVKRPLEGGSGGASGSGGPPSPVPALKKRCQSFDLEIRGCRHFKELASGLMQSNDVVVIVAVVTLIGLFSMQHYGTDKVGWLFAPIVLLWFILIGGVGALNIHRYGSSVLKAYNPVYIYRYFQRKGNSSYGWTMLSGIMLSITGTEALYADLCHFLVLAIQAHVRGHQ